MIDIIPFRHEQLSQGNRINRHDEDWLLPCDNIRHATVTLVRGDSGLECFAGPVPGSRSRVDELCIWMRSEGDWAEVSDFHEETVRSNRWGVDRRPVIDWQRAADVVEDILHHLNSPSGREHLPGDHTR